MTADRPTLLLLRHTLPDLPEFVVGHLRDQVACLRQWFDVVVVDGDCDYARLCDRHEPDLTIVETGVYTRPGRQLAGIGSAPDVPLLGFVHSDAYCASRTRSINDLERWGIEECVTTSMSLAEYTPALADRVFVWPNFVDPQVFHDHGLARTVPVLLTGSQATNYPWRNQVARSLTGRFPVMTTPHGGWFDRRSTARMLSGQRYARLLNTALVVPSCGAIAMELVRKHLEVPATGTCLVAEPSAALAAAGFVDTVNCVLADAADVADRLDGLFADPDELARITAAGHDLVHARHTAAQRDQIKRWYDLRIALQPGERIVWPAPFAAPQVVGAGASAVNGHTTGPGRDRVLLREGSDRLARGDVEAAETAYRRCLNYHFMPEPVVGLARVRLAVGDPSGALRRLAESLELALTFHGTEPDPIEWALWIRAQLCAHGPRAASRYATAYPQLHAAELDRIRLAVALLDGSSVAGDGPPGRAPGRASLHGDPRPPADVWLHELGRHLRLAGRTGPAGRIELASPAAFEVDAAEPTTAAAPAGDAPAGGRPARLHPLGYRIRRGVRARVRRAVDARRPADGFASRLRELAATERLRTVVVVGGDRRDRLAGVLTAAVRANPEAPDLLWIGRRSRLDRVRRARAAGREAAQFAWARMSGALDHADLLVVLDPMRAARLRPAELSGAGIVALRDTVTDPGFELLARIRAGHGRVHDADTEGDGFAILCADEPAPPVELRVIG